MKPSQIIFEADLPVFCKQLAKRLPAACTLYLHGELGAGKTTFCRHLIQALGHQGSVKSPSFTLLEPYDINGQRVYHYDLYRLTEPEELHYLGIEDAFSTPAIRLIEWSEKGKPYLPCPDLDVYIDSRDEQSRCVRLMAHTAIGQAIVNE